MNNQTLKHQLQSRRRTRIRKIVIGTSTRPRFSLRISSQHVIAQLIDDGLGKTLAYVTTAGKKLPANLTQRAEWVAQEIAKLAASAKIKQVVFDRGGKPYHGRVKAAAEAARKAGLEF